MSLELHPNPAYAHGTPHGTNGHVTIQGHRHDAVDVPGHPRGVWVKVTGPASEWFRASPYTAATFAPEASADA